jgi:Ca2+-binding EF-hand superfamily protein
MTSRRRLSVENLQLALEEANGLTRIPKKKLLASSSKDSSGLHNVVKCFHSRVRNEVLRLKQDALCDEDDVYLLGEVMEDYPLLSYENFMNIKKSEDCPEGLRKFFTPFVFLSFVRDKNGCISREDLIRYIQKSIDMDAFALGLVKHSVYANENDNSSPVGNNNSNTTANRNAKKEENSDDMLLTWSPRGVSGLNGHVGTILDEEFERYVYECIPSMSSCRYLDKRFYSFYAYTVTCIFYFYLDMHRRHRLSVKKIINSTLATEWLDFKGGRLSSNKTTKSILGEEVSRNSPYHSYNPYSWFDPAYAEKIYGVYVELDRDGNGTLSMEELYQFTGINDGDNFQLSKCVIKRILEESVTWQPAELDFKGFLNLVLALENKTTTESLNYWWRMINISPTGRLSSEVIIYFYSEIFEALQANEYGAPDPKQLVTEVFDILGCRDERGPTFKDLVTSQQGYVVLSLLTDENGFWMYDNRESLISTP